MFMYNQEVVYVNICTHTCVMNTYRVLSTGGVGETSPPDNLAPPPLPKKICISILV